MDDPALHLNIPFYNEMNDKNISSESLKYLLVLPRPALASPGPEGFFIDHQSGLVREQFQLKADTQ